MLVEQDREAPLLGQPRRRTGFSRLPADLAHIDEDVEWLQSYNEVVLDTASFTASLPSSVEAIFMLDGSSNEQQARASKVRTRFIAEYSLTEDDAPPLLVYDPRGDPPFTRRY